VIRLPVFGCRGWGVGWRVPSFRLQGLVLPFVEGVGIMAADGLYRMDFKTSELALLHIPSQHTTIRGWLRAWMRSWGLGFGA
jgi:hypothetical protein